MPKEISKHKNGLNVKTIFMKKSRILFFLLPLILLTSCIDLIEEIWVGDDGKGKVSFRLESESLGSLLGLASSYVNVDLLQEISKSPKDKAKVLKQVKGIHSIKTNGDFNKGALMLNFNFENGRALNKAYYAIFGLEKKWYYPAIIKVNKHRLKKKDLSKYLKKYINKNASDVKDNKVWDYLNYKQIYHFPQPVKTLKNDTQVKLIHKKTVIQSYSAKDLIQKELNLGNNIRY